MREREGAEGKVGSLVDRGGVVGYSDTVRSRTLSCDLVVCLDVYMYYTTIHNTVI